MQVDARSSYLGQTLNFVSFPPIFIFTSVLQEEKINYLNFLQIQNNLQFRAYVLSTPGFDWKSKKNLKAKKKKKSDDYSTIISNTVFRRSLLFVPSSLWVKLVQFTSTIKHNEPRSTTDDYLRKGAC